MEEKPGAGAESRVEPRGGGYGSPGAARRPLTAGRSSTNGEWPFSAVNAKNRSEEVNAGKVETASKGLPMQKRREVQKRRAREAFTARSQTRQGI